jgi:hypothetical protein
MRSDTPVTPAQDPQKPECQAGRLNGKLRPGWLL